MKNKIETEYGNVHHIMNTGNKFKVQEWILDECCKIITKYIAKVLKCKKKDINYFVNLCITDPPGSICKDNHKNIFYGKVKLLDFFRRAQKEYPKYHMMVNATTVKKVEDIEVGDFANDNVFWIVDATGGGGTDVGGLVSYVWEKCGHIDKMTEDDNEPPWGPDL